MYSDECFLKDRCKRYQKHKDECESHTTCEKLLRYEILYNNAFLTENQRKRITLYPDADGRDREAFMTLKQWQDNIEQAVKENHNLYIWSEFAGNGKTSWAIKLVQAYIDAIWHTTISTKVMFINVPKFFIELKSNISAESAYIKSINENIFKADLVVWDDIGTKSSSPFETENLYNLINMRTDLGKTNFYTSNVAPDKLGEFLGERLGSRVGTGSTCIHLVGSDKRGLGR